MKILKYVLLTYILITGICLAAEMTIQTIFFGTMDRENPPMMYGSGTKILESNPGIGIETYQLLEKKINKKLKNKKVKIEIVRFPWKRLMTMLKSGCIDGLIEASYKKKRLEYGLYPTKGGKVDTERRSTTFAYSFFKLKNNPTSWDGEKFNLLTTNVSVPLGYSIIGMLKKMNIPYETSLSTPNDFKKLAAGRVDIICAIEDVGDGLINLYPDKYKNVEKILPSLKNKPYYLMLSKQFSGSNPDLAELLWDTLAEVRDSEELQQIKLKY